MNRKPFLPSTQADVRKIIGVCTIVFLALIWRGDFVSEQEKVVQIDYLATGSVAELPEEFVEDPFSDTDKALEELLPEILQILEELDTLEEHEVANNFSKLCATYNSLCEKTIFNGSFKNREKAYYFDQISTIVTDVDKIAQRGKTLEEVFSQILVNQTKGNRRGSSGRSKLTMNLGGMKYDDEFRQVFTHEVGHIIDLGALQGKNSTKSTLYTEFGKKVFALDDPSLEYYKYSRQSETIRKSWVSKTDFCSGYGMSDPFEDFAECHNLYLNHHNLFIKLTKDNDVLATKFNYFANLYGGEYFSDSTRSPSEIQLSWRVWDTTRIQE